MTESFNPIINDPGTDPLSVSRPVAAGSGRNFSRVLSTREARFEGVEVSEVRCCKQRGTPLRNRFVIGFIRLEVRNGAPKVQKLYPVPTPRKNFLAARLSGDVYRSSFTTFSLVDVSVSSRVAKQTKLVKWKHSTPTIY